MAGLLCVAVAFSAPLHPRAAGQTHRYTGEITQVIQLEEDPPLRMPTDLAVDRAGRIVVADGVNDRIVVFAADGSVDAVLDVLAGTRVNAPLGVAIAPDEAVWVADTGNHRLVRYASGEAQAFAVKADLTDVLVAADGRVWFTDNDGHRVGWLDSEGSPNWVSANAGLRYPTLLGVTEVGDLLVSEALSGRVQRLTGAGRLAGTIGRYGVDLGQFYRARGIAIGPDATIWVGDARIGVIQIFSETGRFLGVLRDRGGAPLRLAVPTGLAFGPDGSLLVAELASDQVSRIEVTTNAAAPAITGTAQTDSTQPRNCTACHLEWVTPLVEGRGTALLDALENPADHPAVSRSATCLSCHDGSVVDSRSSVWFGHGHQRGMELPEGFEVPTHLPLVGGEIECRTCHSAHTRGGSGDTIARAVFLRVETHAGELCIACHADQASGPGMHPLAKLEPDRLGDVDSHGLDDAQGMTCLACHQGHGGAAQLLRGLGNRDSAECRSCHAAYDGGGGHPLGGPLDDLQRAWVNELGGQVGFDGQMVCASCHRMHGGHGQNSLLLAQPATAAACRGCHQDQGQVIGSAHDLIATHADWQPDDHRPLIAAGACSACHGAHSERPVRPNAIDATGACVQCHQPDGLASSHRLTEWNHPEADCLDCHNPHRTADVAFLRDRPVTVCRACHDDVGALAGGAHDLAGTYDAWPAVSQEAGDACLACHRPHGDADGNLFRNGLAAGETGSDAACIACHPQSGSSASHRLLHPSGPGVNGTLVGGGADGHVRCRDCHDPHAGHRQTPALLRGPDTDMTGTSVCLGCHADLSGIRTMGHNSESLSASGFTAVGCGPCHQSHDGPALAGTLRDGALVSDRCLQCHGPGGAGGTPVIATHPEMDMVTAVGADTALPLEVSASGRQRIACSTCHLPHGRTDLAALPAELRPASHGHLRPFRGPNACTQCHGFEGLERYLYFHDPIRRGGTGEGPGGRPSLWQPRTESVRRGP